MRTGYEAVIRKKFADPMPEYVSFETDTLEKMEAFTFDDPWDDRRWFSAGDNQIAGVGDGFTRNSPAVDRDGERTAPRFPGLRQHLRGTRAAVAHHRDGERDAVDRPVPRGAGTVHRAARDVPRRDDTGADQGRRRAPGRHGHLGRRRVRQRHALLPGFLAHAFQAHRGRADQDLPRGGPAR